MGAFSLFNAARAAAVAMIALTAGFAASSIASSLPITPAEYLARMDLDRDGRIAVHEYRDYLSRGFRTLDADGNGVLEGDELPVPGASPVQLRGHRDALTRAFRRQDRNGDGWLDADELTAPP